MCPSTKNSASRAAGRASDTFCFAAERSEDNQARPHFQGNVFGIDPLKREPTR